MHDLRKKVLLESDKTLSRKARSKLGTPTTSRQASATTSPRASHVASRDVSDDESVVSDTTQWSTNSLSDLLATTDLDASASSDTWTQDLQDRITLICDRKRSSAQGREETLVGFIVLLTRHFAVEELKPHVNELIPALLKSVKAGQTERETSLALKALALMLITDPSETVYSAAHDLITTVINDNEHVAAKIAAIHALGIVTFYGGATTSDTEEVMEFFLDIVSSDGAVVGEADNGAVVTAALEEWGFLATQLHDMEDTSEEAMEALVDQLDSSDANVQIAAGENIALLYEKSYTEAESDDEPETHSDDDDDDDDDTSPRGPGPRMIKRYDVYRQTRHLEQQLDDLARASSKRISKKNRKSLHQAFSDIRGTVEKPTRGPRYSTALDTEGRELGSRMRIYVHGGGAMTIDRWWKLHRLNGLKRLLQSGFMTHYELNQVVFDSLPVIVEDD